MVRNSFGKPTGDAFVLFETEEHGCTALRKHRCSLGSRYAELFRSSQSEVQQVLNSYSNFMHNFLPPFMLPPLPPHLPFPPPFLPPGQSINGFFALDGKFPRVETLELSNPPGCGRVLYYKLLKPTQMLRGAFTEKCALGSVIDYKS